VKLLTSLSPAPPVPFTGGAEFDLGVTDSNLQKEGCPDPGGNCPNLTEAEGAYNALTVFFYDTPAGAFYGGAVGTARLQYLDVPYTDVQFAQANPCPSKPSPVLGNISLQDLYARASRDIFAMANQAKSLPSPTCSKSAPAPAISLVAIAASESPAIAPNTWLEIKGANLSPPGGTRIWQGPDFAGGTMPTRLDNVSVTLNGVPAYVYYISPLQVNILSPPDALSGSVRVELTNNGVISAGFNAAAQPLAPSFFVFNGGPYVAATHADGSLIGPPSLYPGASTPAKAGETIVIYGNGFGPTNVPVQRGSLTQSGVLSPLPAVKIGGVSASVQFAGLVSPGEFQFNVVVPSTVASGDQPITATYGGVSTQASALITIHN
jgi:uncharacterized protein (TIGR03437 family)